MSAKEIVFATTNPGKIREAQQILGIPVTPLDIKIDEVQTLDPVECALKKAFAAYEVAKTPILVEDTSLFIDAWGLLPGVFIDYFMKSLGNEGILRLLGKEKNRVAYAQTTLMSFDGKESNLGIGRIEGEISAEILGNNGFGWDPIFKPKGHDRTFAQMTDEEKNSISMRKLALENLRTKLHI